MSFNIDYFSFYYSESESFRTYNSLICLKVVISTKINPNENKSDLK